MPELDIAEPPFVLTRRGHFTRAAIVGTLSGLLAVGFRQALVLTESYRDLLLNYATTHGVLGYLLFPLAAALVGGFVGWLVVRFAPDAPGSGIPHIKGVMLGLRALNWPALIVVKFVGGVLGIGAGLSLGREGPTVQMGAATGKMVGQMFRLPKSAIPQLLSCGAGAGLAAAFNAPLAGLLFVIEELHRELSSLTLGGALIAAVAATVVSQSFSGQGSAFAIHSFPQLPVLALPLCAALGIVVAVLGVAFNKALLAMLQTSLRITIIPRWGIAAVVTGTMAVAVLFEPRIAGGGHGLAEQLLSGDLKIAALALAVLLLMKFVATVFSYAGCTPGGIFAPMLLMGVIAGSMFGMGAGHLFPSLQPNAQTFAVLGMVAIFVASVRAPLTGVIFIAEMTGNYEQLFALCVTALFAYLTAEILRDKPIYEALLESDLLRRGIEAGAEHEEPKTVYLGIQANSPLAGLRIREAGLPPGCLIIGLERFGKPILPRATLVFQPGDHISVLIPPDHPEYATKMVHLCVGL